MSKYRGVARDEYGNSLNAASVTVYEQDGTTLATIYSDSELATTEANPFPAGTDGTYTFYAPPGYYDVQVAKAGYTTVTLTDELVGNVMAVFSSLDAGQKVGAGSTPNIIGNTNLGAVHLVESYESKGFSIDVDTGVMTYTGAPTIVVECVAKAVYTDAVGGKLLITRIYRDRGGAREEIVAVGNQVTDAVINLGTPIYGVTTLITGDTIGFYFSVGTGTATVDTHDGSYYSVKRIG